MSSLHSSTLNSNNSRSLPVVAVRRPAYYPAASLVGQRRCLQSGSSSNGNGGRQQPAAQPGSTATAAVATTGEISVHTQTPPAPPAPPAPQPPGARLLLSALDPANASVLKQLSSMFSFKHLPAPDDQCQFDFYTKLFCSFVAACQKQQQEVAPGTPSDLLPWPELQPAALEGLTAAADTLQSASISWFPQYGCALLGLPGSPPGTGPHIGFHQRGLAGEFGGTSSASEGRSVAASQAAASAVAPTAVAGVAVDELQLLLVFPDGWSHRLHSHPDGITNTSAPAGTSRVSCGSIPADQLPSLVALVHELLGRLKERRKKDPHFKGLQRTPGLIATLTQFAVRLLRDPAAPAGRSLDSSLDSLNIPLPPGGFVDVGQHSGGQPRDTCWPLLRSMLQVLLEDSPSAGPEPQPPLFQQAMLQLDLWLLRSFTQRLSPAAATREQLSCCMSMLQSAAQKAAALADDGHDVQAAEASCSRARGLIAAAAASRQLELAAEFQLLPEAAANEGWTAPVGTIPAQQAARTDADGLQAARQRAASNLGSLPVVERRADFPAVLRELQSLLQGVHAAHGSSSPSSHRTDDVAMQHALRRVETELFSRAAQGLLAAGSSTPQLLLPKDAIGSLSSLVDQYRLLLAAFRRTAASSACLQSELRSRELLVVWISYCIMFEAIRSLPEHAVLAGFGVAVDWRDLRHLVLTDRLAVDAAMAVAAYCSARRQPGRAAFSLAEPAATFQMAEAAAARDSRLLEIIEQEQQDAATRVAAHWAEVQRKQALARQLHSEIDSLKHNKQRLSREEHNIEQSSWYSSWQRDLNDVRARLASVRRQLQSKEEDLRNAEAAPAPVVQPLPAARSRQLQWVFFLHMRAELRLLSRTSFLAQQLLLPQPATAEVARAVAVDSAQVATSLTAHYNSCRESSAWLSARSARSQVAGIDGAVQLRSGSAVPKNIGPSHIDHFSSPADGVWSPDSLLPCMAWRGSGCSADVLPGAAYFNPWQPLSPGLVEAAFTEQLPPASASTSTSSSGGGGNPLQWAMLQPGSSAHIAATRGNQGIASQDSKPAWMDKPAFLAATNLRAFPFRQLQRLCVALSERELPLEHPQLQLLVRQAVFHVGTLITSSDKASSSSAGNSCEPAVWSAWRAGWDADAGVLQALYRELHLLAEELEQCPRQHDAVLLLGELAAYLSEWHAPCLPVARRFAAMTSRVADELQAQVDAAAARNQHDLVCQLMAKQSRSRMTALLCFSAGELSAADAQRMLRLMVLVNHGDVYLSSGDQGSSVDAAATEQLALLRVRCHDVMARRLLALLPLLQQQPELLTEAVSAVLGRTPPALEWEQLQFSSAMPAASFEAVSSSGQLFSLNALDGTVLLDGLPPSRLPREVTQHALFVRTFGAGTNFEVARTAAGVLQTIRPIHGRCYDFLLSSSSGSGSSSLVISEEERRGDGSIEQLELLDAGADGSCGSWGAQLPVRLRELNSHWLSRKHGAIVLRPLSFQQHQPQFIIRFEQPTAIGTAAPLFCFRVPQRLASSHWLDLLQQHSTQLTGQQLVLMGRGSRILHVLSKFEQPQFIHVFHPANSASSSSSSSDSSSSSNSGMLADCSATVQPGTVFSLPRFSLEFELQPDGSLRSRNFSGFSLRANQQLAEEVAAPAPPPDSASPGGSYTLPDFRQYLVLQRDASQAAAVSSSETLVLVVQGAVQQDSSSSFVVVRPPAAGSGAQLQVHTYEVHGRFGHLQASSNLARLQLAALYAASSSLLPEPGGSNMTGAEIAQQLVRQSWCNKPMTAGELQQLRSASVLGGFLAPALPLLAYELEASSRQLQRLHDASISGSSGAAASAAEPAAAAALPADAASTYQQAAQAALPGEHALSLRQQLTAAEEQRVLHTSPARARAASVPTWQRRGLYQPVKAQDWAQCSEPERALDAAADARQRLVADAEQQLLQLAALEAGSSSGSAPGNPLQAASSRSDGDGSDSLEQQVHAELQHSWECHLANPQPTRVLQGAADVIAELQAQVQDSRQAAEAFLLQHLATVPGAVGSAGACFRLLRLAGAAAAPSLTDLMACAWQPELLLRFNPFLDEGAVAELHRTVLAWLQLCVLEDRLQRLAALQQLAESDKHYKSLFIKELLVHRTWDAASHPKWLVLEAEQRLQIWPAQHSVAAHLIANPGAITQLNMGEGKTRVIIPLLALHWANGSRLVRLNFLSTLLPEALQHLQQTLTASVLGVRLFLQPFHRDVDVDVRLARAMRSQLLFCQQVGGLLLVAPEHRLSLELKWTEMHGRDGADTAAVCGELDELAALPYTDILDESDELLHHRNQLVYACGSPQPLPARDERVAAMQALLHVVSRLADEGSCTELTAEGVALWTAAAQRRPGSFSGLQLLAGRPLESVVAPLHERIAIALLAEPPYPLRWLKHHSQQAAILTCITDPAASSQLLQGSGCLSGLTPNKKDQLLALRGLLACNLLQHCLQKRHNVEFGINRSKAARKRLAVPFRAADTPAERAEFAQPDVGLLLTHLSYYADGLSLQEFKAALDVLLRMGKEAQRDIYSEWLALAATQGSSTAAGADISAFDDVAKIDTSNAAQLRQMHAFLSHNMGAVDFWLSYCVLPSETAQFPYRLTCTSWHLAANATGAVAGFSGTNDNHRLLPLQVKQSFMVEEPRLVATNGMMLDMLLSHATYSTLTRPGGSQQAVPDWQLLLHEAARQQCDALVDAGAVLAGVEGRQLCGFLWPLLEQQGRHQGICFYDRQARHWAIWDGALSQPARDSPLAARDTFVVFDQPRCRGADHKLKQEAVALLSLAAGMRKDQLMQAAGRMRQLGRGQTLRVVGLPEVTEKIREAVQQLPAPAAGHGHAASAVPAALQQQQQLCSPGMRQVLQWVLDNSVRSNQRGTVEWAGQGMHFATTKGLPENSLLPEKLELDVLYGSSKAPQLVADVLSAMAVQWRQLGRLGTASAVDDSASGRDSRLAAQDCAARLSLIEGVRLEGSALAAGCKVVAGQGEAEEECERELEQEEEEEEEQEVQVPAVQPAAESSWSWQTAFAAQSLEQLSSMTGGQLQVLSLQQVVELLPGAAAGCLQQVPWSGKVFCSSNFALTIAASRARPAPASAAATGSDLGQYLRPADAFLLFPATGEVLLLSEREADALQECLLSGAVPATQRPAALLSLAYARLAAAAAAPAAAATASGGSSSAAGQVAGVASQEVVLLAALPPASAARQQPVAVSSAFGRWPQRGVHLAPAAMGQLTVAQLQGVLAVGELVSTHLFNAGVSYGSDAQRRQLRRLVQGRLEAAELLVGLRGKPSQLARSDLEKACDADG